MKNYVGNRDGGFRIAGKRISPDSVVYAFRRGLSPERIGSSFPLLTLEEVYGAIAFYPANKAEVDDYPAKEEPEAENTRRDSLQTRADWRGGFGRLNKRKIYVFNAARDCRTASRA